MVKILLEQTKNLEVEKALHAEIREVEGSVVKCSEIDRTGGNEVTNKLSFQVEKNVTGEKEQAREEDEDKFRPVEESEPSAEMGQNNEIDEDNEVDDDKERHQAQNVGSNYALR
jgi:hypothetical protein